MVACTCSRIGNRKPAKPIPGGSRKINRALPVVLSECQLPDGNWKDVLGQLAPIIERPRLIVFSRNADDRLCAEVLNLGAFDFLITPFREHELVFAIGLAWLDWEGERERRQSWKYAHG